MAFRTTKTLIRGGMFALALGLGVAPPCPAPLSAQAEYAMRGPAASLPSTAITPLEAHLQREGLVNVRTLDRTLIVDLKYAKPNNFMGANVYGDFNRAYLRPEAAMKLAEASRILRARHPELRLIVADALRPRRIQRQMWDQVVDTPQQPYVADPASGSMHNFGAAVDVTLYDTRTRKRLDMGTAMDHFGPLAQPALEAGHLQAGLLSETHLRHRAILRNAMRDAGWHPLAIEWWHFDAFPKQHVRRTYAIIE